MAKITSRLCEKNFKLWYSYLMNKEDVIKLIEIYGKAWETRDPELITTVFTEDATYNDPKEPENIGRNAIKKYWETKVIGEQEDIKFKLLNVWIDGEAVIAEWLATFKDIKRNVLIEMTEVAIFTTREGKFSSLREYYKSVKKEL
jgi:ketosteroid isomerase-like protein